MHKFLIISSLLLILPLFGESKATFAGGCFWCMEPLFDELPGVKETTVGYSGGMEKNPTYEQVSSGQTGHAEVIQVIYDPEMITYQQLLDIFWRNIDPTAKDRQFCDTGRQYRSAIYTHDDNQYQLALKSKEELTEKFNTIYTEIEPAGPFYPAETYHQDYYIKNPFRYKVYRYLCGRDERLKTLWENTP